MAAHVEEVFNTALFDKTQALIALTELDQEGLEFDFAEDGVTIEFEGGDEPQYYQFWEQGVELLISHRRLVAVTSPAYALD